MMQIPARLNTLLTQDTRLHGAVLETLTHFEPWLNLNRVVFFSEYTDHGLAHIENVVLTESGLISDEAWSVLSAADSAALIVATLLHDAGMHLSADGFRILVDPREPRECAPDFDELPWPVLWSDFLGEASRFDDRRLMQLFGDCVPASPPDLNDLSDRDRLLIGEFLRRHHPRLAHEMALWGVPGPTRDPLRLPDAFEYATGNLIGLIARSHGMPLRAAMDKLNHPPYMNRREFQSIHAIYLMSLLRVADYLQIQSERAPKDVLRVTKLRSPLSQREWDVHQCVRDIGPAHDDPELLYINAQPDNITTFARLRQWLRGVQAELDTSWAVLGEVYGRFEHLNQLGLVLRRVRSNITEPTFSDSAKYVPRLARFGTSEAELLSLMVRPLYGNKPEVGIRELMQNSVDAVRELRIYLDKHPDLHPDVQALDGDVVISVEKNDKGKWFVSVSDCGIGMTENIICNYFLKVGASYRRSDAWRATFENDTHQSQVLRSGRFGIGVLAAFLLGDTLTVSTRHISMPKEKGIEFSATVETEAIQLNYVTRPVGTSARVEITESLAKQLLQQEARWDWYCLDEPKVVRRHESASHPLVQHCTAPNSGDRLSGDWRRTDVPGYQDVQWKLSEDRLVCNGIAVLGVNPPVRLSQSVPEDVPNFPLGPHHPFTLSVFDPDGRFPLTLTRDKLVDGVPPFRKTIQHDVLSELLAHLLLDGPTTYPTGERNEWIERIAGFGQLSRMLDWRWHGLVGCLGTLTGFGLIENWTLAKASIRRLLLLENGPLSDHRIASLSLHEQSHAFAIMQSRGLRIHAPIPPVAAWVAAVLGRPSGWSRGDPTTLRSYSIGRRAMIPRASEAEVANDALKDVNRQFQQIGDEWSLLSVGQCGEDYRYQEKLSAAAQAAGGDQLDWILGEWFFNDREANVQPSPLMKLWIETIQQPLIPYAIEERHRQLGHAFRALAPYIENLTRGSI
jgi:molecular chaperone HtpG